LEAVPAVEVVMAEVMPPPMKPPEKPLPTPPPPAVASAPDELLSKALAPPYELEVPCALDQILLEPPP
jgi:hypothetical protein